MASIIAPRLRSHADSVGQPYLRLVSSSGLNDLLVSRPSEQSAKTAVLACLTGRSPDNNILLDKASAAAHAGDGEFYAVLVDSPRTRFGRAQVRNLIEDAILAKSLGAKIVWLKSSDAVGELLQFARKSRVGMIFVTRDRPTFLSGLSRPTVYRDLLRRTNDIRIDIVGFERAR